jgi:hypothetical protein
MFGPPENEPWVWQTRDLRISDAWRSAGINARRFIDFLLIENMNRAGKENGRLKAPQEQLVAFGIGCRYVADAIREAEDLGLVDCSRGGMRVATTYALTWLPLHDGTPANNRWRCYRNPKLRPLTVRKIRNLPLKGKAALPLKGKADGAKLPLKGKADRPRNLPLKGKVPYISSYQGGAVNSDLSAASAGPASGADAPPDEQPRYAPVVVELPVNGRASHHPDIPQEPHALAVPLRNAAERRGDR